MTTTKLALTTSLLLGSAMAITAVLAAAHEPAKAQAAAQAAALTADECSLLKAANLQGMRYVLARQRADLAIIRARPP